MRSAVLLTYYWNRADDQWLEKVIGWNSDEFYGKLAVERTTKGIFASCPRDGFGAALITLESTHIPDEIKPDQILIELQEPADSERP